MLASVELALVAILEFAALVATLFELTFFERFALIEGVLAELLLWLNLALPVELALVVAFLELALVLALPACVELAAAVALLRELAALVERVALALLLGVY